MQLGLKTGMYYLRTRAAADAIKFTVDQQALARNKAARASKGSAAAGLVDAAPLKVTKPLQGLQWPSSFIWVTSGPGSRHLCEVQDINGAARPASSQRIADSDVAKEQELAAMVCSLDNKDSCLMCGS